MNVILWEKNIQQFGVKYDSVILNNFEKSQPVETLHLQVKGPILETSEKQQNVNTFLESFLWYVVFITNMFSYGAGISVVILEVHCVGRAFSAIECSDGFS